MNELLLRSYFNSETETVKSEPEVGYKVTKKYLYKKGKKKKKVLKLTPVSEWANGRFLAGTGWQTGLSRSHKALRKALNSLAVSLRQQPFPAKR